MSLMNFSVCLASSSTFLTNSTLTLKLSALTLITAELVSYLLSATKLLFQITFVKRIIDVKQYHLRLSKKCNL